MNKAIAHILKNALAALPYIDRLSGLVQVAEYEDTNYDESGTIPKKTVERIPVSCDLDGDTSKKHLVPDKSKKGILYFEDGGIGALGKEGALYRYRSRLRLVAWLNTTGITNNTCYEATPLLMNHIIATLEALNATNSGYFLKLQVEVEAIPKADKIIFSPYTYDLHNTQYMLAPYDFFAIDLAVKFSMHSKCLQNLMVSENINLCV